MKKLSVFVEGQTEQIFMEKLISEIANKGEASVKLMKAMYGSKEPRKIMILKDAQLDRKYYIQIIDCGNDTSIQSDIRDNAASLQREGFHKIIGLRDVYPHPHEQIPRLPRLAEQLLPRETDIPVKVLFSITEMETWFLKEHSHLLKIHDSLTPGYIKNETGYDLENDNLEQDKKYHHAAGVLKQIYGLANKSYNKKKSKVQQIVNKLDYEILYLETVKSLVSFRDLIQELDDLFTG